MNSDAAYPFNALLSRMKYIGRWGLMRSARHENLAEHTADVAILTHTLACIGREIYADGDIRPDTLAVAALYHDASEIITGDMPTPVKYKNDDLRTAYKKLERESAGRLAELLPPALQKQMAGAVTGDILTPREKLYLKAADRLSALIKCLDEEMSGNSEFRSAKEQQIQLLQQMQLPAANYFMQHLLPCYRQDLDELTKTL